MPFYGSQAAIRGHCFVPSQAAIEGLRPTPARGWSQKRTIPGGGNMQPEEEVEPFDWEDHLYESWLEEKREREARTENPDK